MNFHKGQKVLCVNDRFIIYCSYPVKKGKVYTIHDFYTCDCGSKQVTLTEKPYVDQMKCGCGRIEERRQSYYNWRFVPLEYFEKFIGWLEIKENPDRSVVRTEKEKQDLVEDIDSKISIEPGNQIDHMNFKNHKQH